MKHLNHEQEVLQLVAEIWEKYPHLRFFQLLELIYTSAYRNSDRTDPFYMEGPDVISTLNKILGNVSS